MNLPGAGADAAAMGELASKVEANELRIMEVADAARDERSSLEAMMMDTSRIEVSEVGEVCGGEREDTQGNIYYYRVMNDIPDKTTIIA